MTHFLHQLGLVPVKEPFKVLIPVGVVMGETFVSKSGKYITSEQTTLSRGNSSIE
jgi:leucyl-tRNA synthetase